MSTLHFLGLVLAGVGLWIGKKIVTILFALFTGVLWVIYRLISLSCFMIGKTEAGYKTEAGAYVLERVSVDCLLETIGKERHGR